MNQSNTKSARKHRRQRQKKKDMAMNATQQGPNSPTVSFTELVQNVLLPLAAAAVATNPNPEELQASLAYSTRMHRCAKEARLTKQDEARDAIRQLEQQLQELGFVIAAQGPATPASRLSAYQMQSKGVLCLTSRLVQLVTEEDKTAEDMQNLSNRLEASLALHESNARGKLQVRGDWKGLCTWCGDVDTCAKHAALTDAVTQMHTMLQKSVLFQEALPANLFGAVPGQLQRVSESTGNTVRCSFRLAHPLMVRHINLADKKCPVYVHVEDVDADTCKAVTYESLCESTPRFLEHYPNVDIFIQKMRCTFYR